MEKYEKLTAENNAVLGFTLALGESMVAMAKSNKLFEEKVAFNNSVFEDVFLSQIQDFVNANLGIKKRGE